jgi:peptide/nickel transport system ATP-binding protein
MLLRVEHLTVTIGANRVVDDVSFEVDRGQRLGIIGESGSGKTLSALSIIGLAPDVATVSGSVVLDGIELLGRSDRELARIRGDGVAMVFQNPMTALNPVMRIGRQISEPLRIHNGIGRADAAAAALEWCERVGLPDPERAVNAYPHQLSGGQRQRVGIAIALACRPGLLIADEPTTALDVTVQADVLALLDALIAEEGTALVFITHDIALVSEVAQSVVVMQAGRIVEHGATEQLVRRPGHEYTAELVAAARRTSWSDAPVDAPVDAPIDEVPA